MSVNAGFRLFAFLAALFRSLRLIATMLAHGTVFTAILRVEVRSDAPKCSHPAVRWVHRPGPVRECPWPTIDMVVVVVRDPNPVAVTGRCDGLGEAHGVASTPSGLR